MNQDHDHVAEALESAEDRDERDDNFDDEWVGPTTEYQANELREIVMMVNQISEKGYSIDYSLRGYDMKHFVVLEGDKCYGQSPKVHAYLSGAQHMMDWSRRKDVSNPLDCHTGDCTSDHEEESVEQHDCPNCGGHEIPDTMTHDDIDGCACQDERSNREQEEYDTGGEQ